MNIKIVIVDDSKLVRDSLRDIITKASRDEIRYTVISTIENMANAHLACVNTGVDVVLLDICNNCIGEGLQAARRIKKLNQTVKVIMMTGMLDSDFEKEAKDIGCEGFWYKDSKTKSVVEMIDKVMQGEIVYACDFPIKKLGNRTWEEYTAKEREVIKVLAGSERRENAMEKMNISSNTLNTHIRNICEKSGHKSVNMAVCEALAKGLISL